MINLYQIKTKPVIIHYLQKDNLFMSIGRLPKDILLNPDLENVDWYLIKDDETIKGVIFCRSFINCKIFHGGAYKEFRGPESPRILSDCKTILKDIYKCPLLSTTPKTNRLAAKLLEKSGMILKTTIKNGYDGADLLLFAEE